MNDQETTTAEVIGATRETAAAAHVGAVLGALLELGRTAVDNPEDIAAAVRRAAETAAAAELHIIDDLLEGGPYNGDRLADAVNVVIDEHFDPGCAQCAGKAGNR